MNSDNNNQQINVCGNHKYEQMAGSLNIFCPCCGDITSAELQKVKREGEVKHLPTREPEHVTEAETIINSGMLNQNYALATQVSAVVMECVAAFINDKKVCIIPAGKYIFMESNLHRFTECLEKMDYSLSTRYGGGGSMHFKEYVIKLDKTKKAIDV